MFYIELNFSPYNACPKTVYNNFAKITEGYIHKYNGPN